MTIQTLKKLIESEFENSHNKDTFKSKIFELLELFEDDNSSYNSVKVCHCNEPEELPYSAICGCNPKNGGSGVCGCTLGNTMVKNPRRYGCGSWTNQNINYNTNTIV